MMVIGRDDNTLQAIAGNGTLLWTAPASHWVTSVAISDNGDTVVAGSMDKTISVYDRAGTRLGTYTSKNAIRARSVAVSGDGSVIAATDGSALYGFSRSQFTQPVPAVATATASRAPVAAVTPVATAMPETSSQPVPVATTTRKAAIPAAVLLFVLGLVVFCRLRRD